MLTSKTFSSYVDEYLSTPFHFMFQPLRLLKKKFVAIAPIDKFTLRLCTEILKLTVNYLMNLIIN